jgi:hypothetical protein
VGEVEPGLYVGELPVLKPAGVVGATAAEPRQSGDDGLRGHAERVRRQRRRGRVGDVERQPGRRG